MPDAQGAVMELKSLIPQEAERGGRVATGRRRHDPGSGGERALTHVLEPASRQVTVSTLTPVRNEERHIPETVAALQAQEFAGAAEFIFIDGQSTDRTRSILLELAREDERIRVLDNPRRHTASGLNIGLRAASGEYVARIDAHTRYPTCYVRLAIERLQQGDVQWVAGPQIPVGTDPWSCRVATALGTRLATGGSNRWQRDVADHRGPEIELRTGVFTGVWRRATLDRAGGWDEGWPINQDSEMASRLLRQGARIVSLPALGAEYKPRSSLGALGRQYRRYGMYRAKTTLRHPWTVRPPHIVLPSLATAAAAAVAARGRARTAGQAVVGAYTVKVVAQSARATTSVREALELSLVFATMHLTWGEGFLEGLIRFARPSTRRLALADDLIDRADDLAYRANDLAGLADDLAGLPTI
jgi:succinoglycan biosynthesis protein ExoA